MAYKTRLSGMELYRRVVKRLRKIRRMQAAYDKAKHAGDDLSPFAARPSAPGNPIASRRANSVASAAVVCRDAPSWFVVMLQHFYSTSGVPLCSPSGKAFTDGPFYPDTRQCPDNAAASPTAVLRAEPYPCRPRAVSARRTGPPLWRFHRPSRARLSSSTPRTSPNSRFSGPPRVSPPTTPPRSRLSHRPRPRHRNSSAQRHTR